MKKYSMIFAACAMLLFVACNKNENNGYTINGDRITFGIGMDQIQNTSKQNYNGQVDCIYFTNDDQAQINGEISDVNPRGGSPSAQASVSATVNPNGTYHLFYPYGIYDAITENAGDYTATATFPNQVILMNRAHSINYISNWTSMAPTWPMYQFIDVINAPERHNIMLNAVSFLIPTIVYGAGWCNYVFSPITGIQDYTDNPCPTLKVSDVVITSSLPLTGSATLNNSDPYWPIMVMDANAGHTIICHAQDPNVDGVAGAVSIVPTLTMIDGEEQEIRGAVGMVPIAPYEVNGVKTFQSTVYFSVDLTPAGATDPITYYYKFVTNESSTGRSQQIERNKTYDMRYNFKTVDPTTTVTPSGTLADGFYETITITPAVGSTATGGGILYRSTTPFPIPTVE